MSDGWRRLRSEQGQSLVIFVGVLGAIFGFFALVADGGMYFVKERQAQNAADAGALAGARDLCLSDGAAIATAEDYAENRNLPDAEATATVGVGPTGKKRITVNVVADAPRFFAGVLGVGEKTVTKRAVASANCVPQGTLGMYVHQRCGSEEPGFSNGNKGLLAKGDNMRVEGAIHVNGAFEVGNPGFTATNRTTVYRPSVNPSLAYPTKPQGSCLTGSSPLFVKDLADSRYCTLCASGARTDPEASTWRDWPTGQLYPTGDALKAALGGCTHTGTSIPENSWTVPRVYCPPSGKFTLSGTKSGPLTVIARSIEVSGNGKLTPANSAHPVLFYQTSTDTAELIINPSGAYDWEGYIINRHGGIKVNASNVTSPQKGLLEGRWLEVNGANFRMLGTGPDSSQTTLDGTTLDE